ncbi:MAG: hypothetical protein ABR520_11345 [Mycobacteriales bacterium]|nr:hypothetical protein [Actinomycetota bacterium]
MPRTCKCGSDHHPRVGRCLVIGGRDKVRTARLHRWDADERATEWIAEMRAAQAVR